MSEYAEAYTEWPDGGRPFQWPTVEFAGTAAGKPQMGLQ